MNREERLSRRRELYRKEKERQQKKGRKDLLDKGSTCAVLTEQQRETILQRRRQN